MVHTDKKIIVENRKAFHDYIILESYEAGVALRGTEVKSIREGAVNLRDSYGKPIKGEIYLLNMHISPYEEGNRFNVDPKRNRKLLLHKAEVNRLIGKVTEKGLTLIPLRLYLKEGLVKVELALARGKRIYDRRESLRRKAIEREVERELREHY
jgi:SsrA-binding protein